jgi:N-acyl homoserine lactone hydrolase
MKQGYKVIALKMGTLWVDRSTLTYGSGFGEKVEIPVWAAAIEGGGRRILVDTGIADPQWVSHHVAPCAQAPDEGLEAALRHIGWTPDSVDTVINTHLHYDHCDNNCLLPNATFYVSRREWEAASRPIATQSSIYNGAWVRPPLSCLDYQLVAADLYEVAPGIRLLQTPGHSAGHMSVLVRTDEGILCITGDAINLPDNLVLNAPPGILYSTHEALASMEKIRRYASRLLTGHDPGLSKYQDGAFPELPGAR